MMYEVEIISKTTHKVFTVVTDEFKSECLIGREMKKTEKNLLAIGIPNGKERYIWFDKNCYSVIVRDRKGVIICGF